MNKETLLFEDKLKDISSKFTKNGWITIYQSNSKNEESSLIYCCLIDRQKRKEDSENHSWYLHIGSEGKPSIWGDNTYTTNAEKGIEPFLVQRNFNLSDGPQSYFDITEEFVLYFNLYEKGENKENRKFYYVDELGDLDEVIIFEPKLIRVKLKYLKEYITMREMYFIVSFSFDRYVKSVQDNWGINFTDEIINEHQHIYHKLIRPINNRIQSALLGKVFIEPNSDKKYHKDFNENYASFIVGYDEEGNELLESCKKTNNNYFKLTYFKKEVLNKYYNEPNKYNVDSFKIRSNFFSLKIDNNIEEYVPVFLVELGYLPFKEQLHWRQYNISPQDEFGMSSTYHKTMIEGNWAEHPETTDLYFKFKYKEFNKKWNDKFGWEFYKPLSEQDKHLFTALHIPTTNNVKAFCEQILSIVKLTIDRLNEKNIQKGITLEAGDKGISKLEKYLQSNEIEIPKMFEFLRNLQSLRSGLMAHTFSKSDKKCKKALEYFKLNDSNYIEVANDIFIKSIFTLNTLEKQFKLDE
ncbi:hypothetical protein [Olleya sp. Hel_I_94]|jgi:hypothetical protein|uniref:hypothetical protein n=1 Tax=Olleya sp. Hel_I_94 TaxID=1250001 RepID=UPI0011A45C96|nr:hypothetical protein [Olleya sp. Hel_I_94]TVZ47450.1 hypothetical protein JM82_2057 [Olleya sp. Hel_I_94]